MASLHLGMMYIMIFFAGFFIFFSSWAFVGVSSEMLHVYGSWFCLPSCEHVSGELQSSRWKGTQIFVLKLLCLGIIVSCLTVSDKTVAFACYSFNIADAVRV